MYRYMPLRTIKCRITNGIPGSIYVTSDFTDIASADTVNRALQRLTIKGVLHKIMRGIYEKPDYSEFLQEYIAPSPDSIAQAIARNYGWTITPSSDAALNILGLSTQVPSVWIYASDGPYKEYSFNSIKIKFKHTATKDLSQISNKTALLIQALKALGKTEITDNIISKISSLFSIEEKQKMIDESKYTTAWIYEIIKEIAKRDIAS